MIIWIGNIYNYNILKNNKKLSAAASDWQSNFVKAISTKNHTIKILSHLPSNPWPFGNLYINLKIFKKIQYIKYINLPFLKNFLIKKNYKIKLNECLKTNENNIIFTYNFDKNIVNLVSEIKQKNKFKWYFIIADFDDHSINKINQILSKCDKVIILSKTAYKKIKHQDKILFHGGINIKDTKFNNLRKRKTFFYSGSTDNWTNFEKFILDFKKINIKEFSLKFTAPAISQRIKKIINNDDRINYLGFLNSKKYNREIKNSDILISLRNLKNKNNFNNFPSKILRYLEYNKLIISDNNLSFENKFKEALILNKGDNYFKILKKINEYTNTDYNLKIKKIKNIKKIYSWNNQIKKIKL